MSGKDNKNQDAGDQDQKTDTSVDAVAQGKQTASKEERLAEALRANLRRRKAAAKARKGD